MKPSVVAWIPFRAQTAGDALGMFAKLISLGEWLYLGMRENTYLVAAIVFVAMILAYLLHEHATRWLAVRRWTSFVAETMLMGAVVAGVFVFLRPISQFIYFQF